MTFEYLNTRTNFTRNLQVVEGRFIFGMPDCRTRRNQLSGKSIGISTFALQHLPGIDLE